MPQFQTRAKAALAVASVLTLWGAVENFQIENRANQLHDPYMVNDQPRRLTAAMQMIPRDAIVGYVSDLKDKPEAWLAIFNTARYTVAPRLLVDGPDREWVLGNFSKPGDYAALGREHGVDLVQDFGDGVVLYKGRALDRGHPK